MTTPEELCELELGWAEGYGKKRYNKHLENADPASLPSKDDFIAASREGLWYACLRQAENSPFRTFRSFARGLIRNVIRSMVREHQRNYSSRNVQYDETKCQTQRAAGGAGRKRGKVRKSRSKRDGEGQSAYDHYGEASGSGFPDNFFGVLGYKRVENN